MSLWKFIWYLYALSYVITVNLVCFSSNYYCVQTPKWPQLYRHYCLVHLFVSFQWGGDRVWGQWHGDRTSWWLGRALIWLCRTQIWLGRVLTWLDRVLTWLGRALTWLGRAQTWLGRVLTWLGRALTWLDRALTWLVIQQKSCTGFITELKLCLIKPEIPW